MKILFLKILLITWCLRMKTLGIEKMKFDFNTQVFFFNKKNDIFNEDSLFI